MTKDSSINLLAQRFGKFTRHFHYEQKCISLYCRNMIKRSNIVFLINSKQIDIHIMR